MTDIEAESGGHTVPSRSAGVRPPLPNNRLKDRIGCARQAHPGVSDPAGDNPTRGRQDGEKLGEGVGCCDCSTKDGFAQSRVDQSRIRCAPAFTESNAEAPAERQGRRRQEEWRRLRTQEEEGPSPKPPPMTHQTRPAFSQTHVGSISLQLALDGGLRGTRLPLPLRTHSPRMFVHVVGPVQVGVTLVSVLPLSLFLSLSHLFPLTSLLRLSGPLICNPNMTDPHPHLYG